MRIERVGSRQRSGVVGQLVSEPLCVKIMNDDGTPVKDEPVTFETSPEGCAEFEPGGHSWSSAKTDGEGVARMHIRPTRIGEFKGSVRVRTQALGLFDIRSVDQEVVAGVGANPVVIRRRPQETRAGFGWPAAIALATAVVALAVVLSLLGLKALSGKGGGTGPAPGPGPTPVVSGRDDAARREAARAHREIKRVEGESQGELAHRPARHEVEGYVEARVRPGERWAFGAANTTVEHIRDTDAHDGVCTSPACITACRIDPDLPACRPRRP